MNPTNQKIIFLNSYSPRSGHNFVSEALKVVSGHEVLIHKRSETRLSQVLDAYYEIYNTKIHYQTDKDYMDSLLISGLRDRILLPSEKEFVMIKDTTLLGVNHLKKNFPEDIHIILLRDPKAVFNSVIKSMRLGRPTFNNSIKKLGIKLGVYPYYFTRKICKRVIPLIPDLDDFVVLRYEDLVKKDEETLKMLKEMFGSEKSLENIKAEIDGIGVINSSFFEEVKGKDIWDEKPKTEKFNPIDRKGNSFLVRIAVSLGCSSLRKKLGYTS